MSLTAASGVRGALREYFLLERAEQRSVALTPSQREAVRAYYDAAARRLSVAGTLRGPSQTPVAIALYREAWMFLVHALMISRDAAAEPRDLSRAAAFDRMDSALLANEAKVPAELDAARALLTSSDPLLADRLPPEEASQAADALETALRWLLHHVEARSPRAVKVTRVARLGVAIASAIVLLVGGLIWGLSPTNVALHKPTRSSPPSWNTAPEGAVDGEKNGTFGFHSVEEDSPSLTIDLLRPHKIMRVKVFGRGDGYNDQSIPLALEVSDDGAVFRKIAERTEAFSEADPWVVEVSPLVTRFVRLRTERHSVLVLSEVEVYGRVKH
ncbi:MAG: discoidin domain-containing protein [Myxococcota bacterium]|nr:discoidin domain-containing protein [Myxococcota bacterium]